MKRSNWFLHTWLLGGFAFLYLPIASLVIYSFNDSKLATVWAGFSTKWYGGLLHNQQILDAAWLSLKIAAMAASLATTLGTLAALCLVRFGPFRGRALFSGLVAAPLVMPEVITGLSLLLMFVALERAFGWPAGRGTMTIVIGHATFAMAYVTVVVQARLVGMDPSLDEAALDLGARPAKVFLVITLPLISPALIAGWLLAFTLSLDDLVVSSFVSGPGATTLPMVIYSKVRLGLSPEINALGTLLITAVAVAMIAVGLLLSRQDRGRVRDAQLALGAKNE